MYEKVQAIRIYVAVINQCNMAKCVTEHPT